MTSLEDVYPPFRVRIHCGAMELRPLTPDLITQTLELAKRGIYDKAGLVPFLNAWDQDPRIDLVSPGYYYSSWNDSSPARWSMLFTVWHDGELVGVQELMAPEDFRITRRLETGSWLGREFQGRGLGTLMRQMVVAFALDELGALELQSAYLEETKASAAVSRKVGYAPNGQRAVAVEGQRRMEHWVRLTPETFVRPADDVIVENADAFRAHFEIEVAR